MSLEPYLTLRSSFSLPIVRDAMDHHVGGGAPALPLSLKLLRLIAFAAWTRLGGGRAHWRLRGLCLPGAPHLEAFAELTFRLALAAHREPRAAASGPSASRPELVAPGTRRGSPKLVAVRPFADPRSTVGGRQRVGGPAASGALDDGRVQPARGRLPRPRRVGAAVPRPGRGRRFGRRHRPHAAVRRVPARPPRCGDAQGGSPNGTVCRARS